MPPLTISQLQFQLAQYSTARRRRDLPLAALLVLSLLILASAIVLGTIFGASTSVVIDVSMVGFALLGCTGLYVIATTRPFHLAHAPKCPHCGAALPHLVTFKLLVEWLRELEQTAKERPDLFETWSANAGEKISEAARLRCPRCEGIVAAPAV